MNVYVLHLLAPTMKWICIYCNSVMDCTNFTDFIKQSDNDKNTNQEAKVQYHAWRLLTPNEEEIEAESEMLLQLC
jgi:hypothetical protein